MPTLEELDGEVWGEPEFDSHLVVTCRRLRKKPIDEFTVEDLRIMIGQNIGLQHLIPKALTILEDDPLAEGDYFPGDLLKAATSVDTSFYERYPSALARTLSVARLAIDRLQSSGDEANLLDLLQRFVNKNAA